MSCTCVVGLQWGDEAKGKIVDLLGNDHNFVVRYNGGNNAGHTVVWEDRTFKLSLLPTGVLKPNLTSVIGNGVVVYPPKFIEEVTQLECAGISIGDNLRVSDHAHLIMPYHLEEERASDGGSAIGTTGRGIGPCYQDKVGRINSVRVGELLQPDYLRERLETIVPRKNKLIAGINSSKEPVKHFEAKAIADEYLGYAEKIKPFVTNTSALLHQGLKAGKKILFEAAQGSLLDVDHGTYPYVTSSSSLPSGIWAGTGIPTRHLSRIIGVVKAYSTRVGRGPMPTELTDGPDGIGERIRKVGREYGTVTGRPRRTGWFDAVAARYTAELAGVDEITVMLLDVLSGIETLSICTGYEIVGHKIDSFLSDAFYLEQCKPVYETMLGWSEDITKARRKEDLPIQARRYVARIEELIEKKVSLVSVGPGRAQTISFG